MRLDIALVHYPVFNKNQETIGSAVTNLDIHDIARAGKTYGVERFFIVTPFADQQELVGEIIDHWLHGHGAHYNRDRCEAFSIVTVCSSLADLYAGYGCAGLRRPLVVATSARDVGQLLLSYGALR
ncbi:MAG: RNA methyltransferase, partial [Desulfobulbaceae bacterium]|nr:RNA methyltransferase [Desulfobulbaceae bacterium]